MIYLITFLEGLISFISPCMLPMLPVYVSYFAAGEEKSRRVWPRALAFVIGFTFVFCALGVFAGTLGGFLIRYRRIVSIVCGCIVILFGLSYLNIIPLTFFKGMGRTMRITGVFSAFVFGVIYSVSLTPCVGAYLGSALMLASTAGSALTGVILLLCYSVGLGLPFFVTAVLLKHMGAAFDFIKKHYRVINTVCGLFLILIGLCMAMGWLNRWMSIFT